MKTKKKKTIKFKVNQSERKSFKNKIKIIILI